MKHAPTPDAAWHAARLYYEAVGPSGAALSVGEIAQRLKRDHGIDATRESIYPLLRQAYREGFVKLVPPKNPALVEAIRHAFPLVDWQRVDLEVVSNAGHARAGSATAAADEPERVAAVAAERVLELTVDIYRRRRGTREARAVGLGLGPGMTGLDFTRRLARLLDADMRDVQLSLFALTAGGLEDKPEQTPGGFFNLIGSTYVKERFGLFAPTLVPALALQRVKGEPGVKKTFEHAGNIDIVVSGIGDMEDEHDLLVEALQAFSTSRAQLRERGWLGNVQYRPFGERGPIVEKGSEMRAVTLFELADLARMAREKDKHVVLMVAPCRSCHKSRAPALATLLRSPALQVFNVLIVDERTAKDLVDLASAERGPAGAPAVAALRARAAGKRVARA
jgi:hypothetical protein